MGWTSRSRQVDEAKDEKGIPHAMGRRMVVGTWTWMALECVVEGVQQTPTDALYWNVCCKKGHAEVEIRAFMLK